MRQTRAAVLITAVMNTAIQKREIEEEKEKGEWKDLIIQNLLWIEAQVLEIGELAGKKLGVVLVPPQVVKH